MGSASLTIKLRKSSLGHKAPVDKASSPTAKRPKNKSKPDDALAELIRCFDNAPEEAQTTFLTRLGGERILKVQSLRSWFQERLDRQRARVTNDAGQANMEPAPETKITKAFKAALSLVEAGDKHSAEAISKLHAINRIADSNPIEAGAMIEKIARRFEYSKPRIHTNAPPPSRSPKGGTAPYSPDHELTAWLNKTYPNRR